MSIKFSIIFLLILGTGGGADKWLHSPRATTWGEWGVEERCPPAHFVNSFRINYQSWRLWGDDTAMNGIQLHCTSLAHPQHNDVISKPWLEWKEEENRKYITSRVGTDGKWLEWTTCACGVAIGFMLNTESYQGDGDDTSANDIKLKCLSDKGNEWWSERGGGGINGDWTQAQKCPPGMAICGLKTQVEPSQDSGDNTGLNNVDMLCCPTPNPALMCSPTDSWKQVLSGDYTEFVQKGYLHIRTKYGISRALSSSQVQNILDAIAFQKGTLLLPQLKTVFIKIEQSNVTGFKWAESSPSVIWLCEEEYRAKFMIPENCGTTISQVVGRCGNFLVRTTALIKQDLCR